MVNSWSFDILYSYQCDELKDSFENDLKMDQLILKSTNQKK